MRRAQARTLDEAYAYLELTLPAGESWLDFERFSTVERVGDGYLLRFVGGDEGTVEVAVATRPDPDDTELTFGSGPSTLIDPGQWYLIECGYAGMAQAGLDRLAGGLPDEETYQAIYRAFDSARAAVQEIGKFLPYDADAVPAAACWTGQGRSAYLARPGAFRRDRLTAAASRYRQHRDGFADRFRPAPEVVLEVAAPPRTPTAAPARTFGEAHIYMDLHPCACGSAQFRRGGMEVLASDDTHGLVVRYAGPCDGCGRPRDFRFRLPNRPGVPPESPYLLSYPEDGPSRVLDPGDWVATAVAYGAWAEEVAAADGVAEEDIVKLLTVAAAAVDEALRFLPPGAGAVPPDAFWTPTGQEVYRLDPDLFRRDRLVRERADRWARLGEFLAALPEDGSVTA